MMATEAMDNGTVKTQYNYTPFGKTEIIGEQSDNPFMFTGREWDGATGLYYYRARYYSAEMGRFISEDPIGLAGGINMYAYVGGNPINRVDPLGLWYVDMNLTLGLVFGVSGGLMFGPEGIYPYWGMGLTSGPGFSITGAPFDDPTVNCEFDAFQAGHGIGGQVGVSTKKENGHIVADDIFWEVGIASPGASLMGYRAYGPFWFW